MATSLTIDRLHARYRLGPGAQNQRTRLDRVLGELVSHGLERALEGGPADAPELVCVRALDVPVRLRLTGGDSDLLNAWSQAFAAALSEAVAGGGPGVVRYATRRTALLDLARGVARGDRTRAWAWAQLGLWPRALGAAGADRVAVAALVDALLAEPEAIVAVLDALAAGGDLEPLAPRLEPAQLIELAVAALRAAGADPSRALDRPATDGPVAASALVAGAGAVAFVAILVAALAAGAEDTVGAPQPPPAIVAVAALAVLRGAPALAGADSSALAAAICATAVALRDAPGRPDLGPPPPSGASSPPGEEAGPREPDPDPASEPPLRTERGGLCFLLHVLDELGIAGEIAGDPRLCEHAPPDMLAELAQRLAPVAREDPAVLAFCGGPPSQEPPALEPMASVVLDALAQRVLDRAAQRLGDDAETELPLLDARAAEVVVDAGWIELRLDLDGVRIAVRRAGLDLDPGWMPWLGAVVRFVYG